MQQKMSDASSASRRALLEEGSSQIMEEKVVSEVEDGGSFPNFDFRFAFKNAAFADRTLCLETRSSEEVKNSTSESDEDITPQDLSQDGGSRKRIRISEDQAVTCTSDKPVICTSIPIVSAVLAAKSSVFMKLFTNGMHESEEKTIRLEIKPEERSALLELLKFMYIGHTSPTFFDSTDSTIQLLLAADKYDVKPCFTSCVEHLKVKARRHNVQDAITIIEALEHLDMGEPLHSLLECAKGHIIERFASVLNNDHEDPDFIKLPVSVLTMILESDALLVKNEEEVFHAVIAWVRHKYTQLESRQRVMTVLVSNIRFCWIQPPALEAMLNVPEMQTEGCKDMVLRSLLTRAGSILSIKLTDHGQRGRPRKGYRPPTGIGEADLSFITCQGWSSKRTPQSQREPFCVEGKWFRIHIYLTHRMRTGRDALGLFLELVDPSGRDADATRCRIQFRVLTSDQQGPQVVKASYQQNATPRRLWGSYDSFNKPWPDIIGRSSYYFPKGVMRVFFDVWINDAA